LARNVNVANVCAYLAGSLDLDKTPLLRWIGAGQFRKLAVLSCMALVVTVTVTCCTQHEHERPELRSAAGAWSKIVDVVRNLTTSVRTLPRAVKRVCFGASQVLTLQLPRTAMLQPLAARADVLAAASPVRAVDRSLPLHVLRVILSSSSKLGSAGEHSLTPFRARSTTYVAEAVSDAVPPGSPAPSADTATRAGSFALLLYALVALVAGIFLPHLSTLATTFPSLPRRSGRVGRRLLRALSMRNLWTLSLAWYALCMAATFWVDGVRGTTLVVALAGLSWAVTCWVRRTSPCSPLSCSL